jgi:alanyl-tRNA synthetase
VPCKKIDRYPVIARWRNDVDYVAAGIFCFQPYCVTGEMDPPANPLICPQFCLRFNDLDNIGLTGRHFSGFVMIGIQVFNKPGEFIFFKDECVEFNYRWLTEELKIDPEEITFIEDIWAGGGNLGPCVEYFIHGLELGNMVFMQYKYDHEGRTEELPVKVIDVGIGLERIPWLINGSPTSYIDVFKDSLTFLLEKTGVPLNNEVWEKLGPYTCQLNIDEVEDIDKVWKDISAVVNLPVEEVKQAIMPVKDLYVVLDHTRSVLMIIQDGGLPSNTGGGSNCRNVLRRVFAILKKNGWWDAIGQLEGLLRLFDCHREDLSRLYGPFSEYKSFGDIIKIEYERWASTETAQKKKLEQLVVKSKGKLSLDNWIMIIQSWGIPADAIAQICNLPVPDNLYAEIASREEKVAKATELILYDTIHYTETHNLYYENHRLEEFDAIVIGLLQNVEDKPKGKNILILDASAFYPTSGGQVHDLGSLTLGEKTFKVYDVQKVGKCFLHYIDQEVDDVVIGQAVHGKIDVERRNTLRAFHTGTHIVYAAARRILGPHIWQNGAKKTENYAHLDITHYSSISKEVEMEIENEANRIILEGHPIRKYFEGKKEAESKHGFNLYQGGIVPGNTIRVVNIEDVDVEACCGTHCDNTSEVGWIKIFKSARVSDGILRLYYMANKKVLKALNEETSVINSLKDLWGINQAEITQTARRIFDDYKRFEKENQSQKISLLSMHARYISESKLDTFIVPSLEKELTLYFANIKSNLAPIVVPLPPLRKATRPSSSSTTPSSSASSPSPNTSTWNS